jgi:hypothetical protein
MANKSKGVIKQRPEKQAVKLDDLIPNEEVMGGGRVIFGARSKPACKPSPLNPKKKGTA